MKKIVHILLITALTVLTQSATTHADIKLASEEQIQYLMGQAQFLAQHGVAQEDVLKIFEQSLTEQELGVAKSNTGSRMIIILTGCVVCIAIGGGVTYYFMNEKLNEKQAEIDRFTTENQQQQQDITTLNQQLAQAQAQAQRPQAQNPFAAMMQQLQQNQGPRNPLDAILQQFEQATQNNQAPRQPQNPLGEALNPNNAPLLNLIMNS